MSRALRQKQRDQRWGRWSETVATWWLRAKGYHILDRRWRVKGGEIDIIARKRRLIIFVEVKARRTVDAARFAVTATKSQRVTHAAALWISRKAASDPALHGHSYRLDAVLIAPWQLPCHVPDVAALDVFV